MQQKFGDIFLLLLVNLTVNGHSTSLWAFERDAGAATNQIGQWENTRAYTQSSSHTHTHTCAYFWEFLLDFLHSEIVVNNGINACVAIYRDERYKVRGEPWWGKVSESFVDNCSEKEDRGGQGRNDKDKETSINITFLLRMNEGWR